MVRINLVTVKQVKEKSGLYDLASKSISSPKDAVDIIQTVLRLDEEAAEKFGIINLNTKNVVTGIHVISIGSLNATIVHPREVFKAAMLNNASSIIAFHNHPSGNPDASPEDIEITNRLKNAGNMLGIELLDHVIIGDCGRYCSLKETGLV